MEARLASFLRYEYDPESAKCLTLHSDGHDKVIRIHSDYCVGFRLKCMLKLLELMFVVLNNVYFRISISILSLASTAGGFLWMASLYHYDYHSWKILIGFYLVFMVVMILSGALRCLVSPSRGRFLPRHVIFDCLA